MSQRSVSLGLSHDLQPSVVAIILVGIHNFNDIGLNPDNVMDTSKTWVHTNDIAFLVDDLQETSHVLSLELN